LSAIESVVQESSTVSRWHIAIGPFAVRWTAEIVEEIPNELLSWRSLPGSDVDHEGRVEVTEYSDDASTLFTVEMRFRPNGAIKSTVFRRLARAVTEQQLAADLIRFRQFLETGEISTGAAQVQKQSSSAKLRGSPSASATDAELVAEA